MSVTTIGIIGVIILVIMLFSRMPVGFVMGFLGFIGFSYVRGLEPGLSLIAREVFDVFSSYGLTVVPLFVLMGEVMFHSGIATMMLDTIDKWLTRLPGRLALMAVAGGTLLATLTGTSIASVALLGKREVTYVFQGLHAMSTIG